MFPVAIIRFVGHRGDTTFLSIRQSSFLRAPRSRSLFDSLPTTYVCRWKVNLAWPDSVGPTPLL
jgi:hypothetical protein